MNFASSEDCDEGSDGDGDDDAESDDGSDGDGGDKSGDKSGSEQKLLLIKFSSTTTLSSFSSSLCSSTISLCSPLLFANKLIESLNGSFNNILTTSFDDANAGFILNKNNRKYINNVRNRINTSPSKQYSLFP